MDEDTKQIPVWTVQGKNWFCNVPLDEYNSQFSPILQAEEAGTRAIEQFQGQDRGLTLSFPDNEQPELGGVILVYLLNSNPDDGFLLMVHEMLANGAFYKDSIKVEALTRAVIEANIEDDIKADIEAEKQIAKKTKAKTPKKPKKTPKPKKPKKKP